MVINESEAGYRVNFFGAISYILLHGIVALAPFICRISIQPLVVPELARRSWNLQIKLPLVAFTIHRLK